MGHNGWPNSEYLWYDIVWDCSIIVWDCMILPDMNYWYVWCYMILLDIYIYIQLYICFKWMKQIFTWEILLEITRDKTSIHQNNRCLFCGEPGEDLGGRNRHLASSLERWMDFQAPIFCQEKPLVDSFPLNGTCFQSSFFGWGGVWLILKHLQISMATLQPEIWRERLYQSNTVNTRIYCNS